MILLSVGDVVLAAFLVASLVALVWMLCRR